MTIAPLKYIFNGKFQGYHFLIFVYISQIDIVFQVNITIKGVRNLITLLSFNFYGEQSGQIEYSFMLCLLSLCLLLIEEMLESEEQIHENHKNNSQTPRAVP